MNRKVIIRKLALQQASCWELKTSDASSCPAVFLLATLNHTAVTFTSWLVDHHGQIIKATTEAGSWTRRMLNLQPGAGLPFALRQFKVLENRGAASLQEMHSGSFALLSNRVNELNLPTICSSPKESATDKRSLCNGWTCRSAPLHRSFCGAWSRAVADGASNLGQTS